MLNDRSSVNNYRYFRYSILLKQQRIARLSVDTNAKDIERRKHVINKEYNDVSSIQLFMKPVGFLCAPFQVFSNKAGYRLNELIVNNL